MFLYGTGKYQDVANKDDNEVIKIFAEDVLYQCMNCEGAFVTPKGITKYS